MLDPHLRHLPLLALVPLVVASAPTSAGAADSVTLASCPPSFPLTSAHPASTLVPDGAGGAFVTWTEPGPRVRLQHVRADLTRAKGWPADGLIIGVDAHESRNRCGVLASDDAGGVYVAWVEDAHFETSVRLLRIRGDGTPVPGWPEHGVALSRPGWFVTHPAITAFGRDGVAVAWIAMSRHGKEVRAQMIGPRGEPAPRWREGGVVVDEGDELNDLVELAAGGDKGLYLLWTKAQGRLSDVKYVLVSKHAEVWGPGGGWLAYQAVPPHAAMEQSHPQIAPDGSGGALMAWTDERASQRQAWDLTDVFAERVHSGLIARGWNGPVAVGRGYQLDPRVVADGAGGCYIAWNEMGPGRVDTGRLARFDGAGHAAPGWPEEGIALGKVAPLLASDGAGGALVVRNDGDRIVAQRFRPDAGAAPGWPAAGLAVASTSGKGDLVLSPDGRGGAFVAWEERTTGRVDVVLRHLAGDGSAAPAANAQPAPAPLAFAVHRAFPSPARSHSRIGFDLPAPVPVSIDVCDVMGRRVGSLAERKTFEAGPQTVAWDLRDRGGRRVAPRALLRPRGGGRKPRRRSGARGAVREGQGAPLAAGPHRDQAARGFLRLAPPAPNSGSTAESGRRYLLRVAPSE